MSGMCRGRGFRERAIRWPSLPKFEKEVEKQEIVLQPISPAAETVKMVTKDLVTKLPTIQVLARESSSLIYNKN